MVTCELGLGREPDTDFAGKHHAPMLKGRGVKTVLELDGRL